MDQDGLFCISEGGVSGLSPRISLMDRRGTVVARWDSLGLRFCLSISFTRAQSRLRAVSSIAVVTS